MNLIKRIKTIGLAAVMTFGLLLPSCSVINVSADNVFSNDSIATAKSVSLNTTYDIVYDIGMSSKRNYYVKFTIPNNGLVTVTVNKPVIEQNYANFGLYVYNESEEQVSVYKSEHEQSSSNFTSNIGLKKGTYYINILNMFSNLEGSGNITSDYNISFIANYYYESEPNDGLVTATPISLGKNYIGFTEPDVDYNYSGSYDYYKIYIPKEQKVRITIGNYKELSSIGGPFSTIFSLYVDNSDKKRLEYYKGDYKYDSLEYKFNNSNDEIKISTNGSGYIDKYLSIGTYYLSGNFDYFFDKHMSYSINISTLSSNTTPKSPSTAPTAVSPSKTTRSAAKVEKDKKNAETVMNQAKLTKLSVKSKAKKKITVSWKKVSKAKGYQVQVSTNKKFKKSKIILTKNTKNKKLIIKNSKIKSKKTYYVRVRAYSTYKDINNVTQKVYSKWNKKLRMVKVK